MQHTALSEKLSKLLERQEDEQLAYNNGMLPGQANHSPGYHQGYSHDAYIQQPRGYGYEPDSYQRQPPLSYGQEPRMSHSGAPQNPNAANWATFTSFVDSEYHSRLMRLDFTRLTDLLTRRLDIWRERHARIQEGRCCCSKQREICGPLRLTIRLFPSSHLQERRTQEGPISSLPKELTADSG
jgi:hypothetical protein